MKYLKNILISIDQLVNTLAGGDPDMTISARLGRNYKGTWLEKFVDWMFQWQGNPNGHCENADWWESDEGKDAVLAFKDKNNKNLG
jgi:hypothetical protein